ncbi:MAG: ABC transporter ATP-binding protein [Acidobacteriota bacterium]|nr:ABC transporter ATP-binding protein [Acidobacteriota bacterium]
MSALARAREVVKRFGALTAVDGVDLAVEAGEVVGLLGANGAGKTTLIRALLGLTRPSSGEVELFGAAPSVASRRRVGYMPQTLGLYRDLTVEENWAFSAAAYRRASPAMPAGVAALRRELVGHLALGVQREVAFAVAFAHEPELLILDEPSSGVGPVNGAQLWEGVRAGAQRGVGVLVTTHNMDEAEQCDRLVIMAEGRVLAQGTLGEVVAGRRVVEVRGEDWRAAFAALDAAGLFVQVRGDTLRVAGSASRVREALGRSHRDARVEEVPANLEEAFVEVSQPRP